MSIEGAVHEPTFVYRVTVGEITATGTGQSKKKAKHSAAKAILEAILSGQNSSDSLPNLPATTNDQNSEIAPMLSQYDDGIPGNPVGALQEFCMSRRWPPPSYNVVEEQGLPHERMFTMACTVKKYVEKGTGKSKKLAKRQAAHKMYEYLKALVPSKNENSNNIEDDDDEPLPGLKDGKIPTLTPAFRQKISQFYVNLRADPGKTLIKLHNSMPSPNSVSCIQFLQEIANEHNFEVTYVDIEERSKIDQFQCLVQLSTLPVAVCHGTGVTAQEAQVNAAENALEYLRIMTRG